MTNLLYLGIAIVISGLAILVLWYRNRKPRSLQSGIEEFQRELRALAPQPPRREQSGPGPAPSKQPEHRNRPSAG